jgi:3D-(3,5/4)-trihydroxycyclohexane-1,2-dione acylhydrolase (decyclizing)
VVSPASTANNATLRMTMAQAIVRFLAQQYVERDGKTQRMVAGMFGIFGHGIVSGLGQALEEVGEGLPFYQARNEQAMVHTAAAYARMKNRLQILACTSSVGPGATNMITGAASATVNRIPVLLLPGDTFASRLPHPVLQQVEYFGGQDVSVNDAFRPVSRYWDRISRPEQILSSLPEAMRVLLDQAETGAVTIALPEDVQTMAYDYPAIFFRQRLHRIFRTLPAPAATAEAVQRIRAAKRPLIVAGGGVLYSEASAALDALAGTCGIPVVETQAGKGALPWDHPWSAGPVGATGGIAGNRLAESADLVIVIGTRLSDFTTASKTAFQNPDVSFIGVNVTPMDANKLSALPLVGDARSTIEVLTAALRDSGYRTSDMYAGEVKNLKAVWNKAVDLQRATADDSHLTQAQVIGIVNDFARPTDVVVCASGGLPGDLHKLWRASDAKGYHVEYGYSCMGYEIAGGHGVKMADPSREVYVMVGDGSYLMLHTEIVTSLQESKKITVVVLDNSGFQCIRSLQQSLGSPSFSNEMRYRSATTGRLDGSYVPIDFVKNAESLGASAYLAATPGALRSVLELASHSTQTVVIHVPVDVDARVPDYDGWWDVPVAEVSEEPAVVKARSDYEAARMRQRYF